MRQDTNSLQSVQLSDFNWCGFIFGTGELDLLR